MPTLQDVARKAGVSTATVSKVLSNTPYFSEATRDKVMRAVEEVGYMPNLAARALTSGKTHIIGVVFPYMYETIFEDAYVMSMLQGVEVACWERNYNILLCTPRIDDQTDKQYHTLVQSGYFDGIISLDSIHQTSFSEFARDNNVPNVVLGFHHAPYSVRCDDRSGSYKITDYLLSLGHRQLGIITVPEKQSLAIDERLEGIYEACEAYGIDGNRLPIQYGNYSVKSGYQATCDLLKTHPTITGIISINDRMAIGAIQCLQDQGKQVPQDVSVVGFDNIEHSRLITPALTTIDQQPVEQGRLAAMMLFDLFDGQSPDSVILDARLIIRDSSAQPAPKR